MQANETFTLANGLPIPRLALGTWLMTPSVAESAVENALQIGYRHIDTAQAYENEQAVGLAVRNSNIPRENLFLTSKIAAEIKSYSQALSSIDESLQRSGLEYFDLMLIHCPQPWAEYPDSPNRYCKENQQVWKALENAFHAGKVKAIGVSNFLETDIENLLSVCEIPPMVNQIRVNVTHTPKALIHYCQQKQILVEAYSPIAHGDALHFPLLVQMAEKYGVSVAQLCINYVCQLGLIALPKTTHPDFMRKNLQLDFTIEEEDMQILENFHSS